MGRMGLGRPHDLETMIMRSPALEKVLGELCSEEKVAALMKRSGKDVRTLLLECARPVGYLRWISLRENLALSFEGLEFSKFIIKETMAIDIAGLIKSVKEHSYSTEIDKSRKQAITKHDTHKALEQIKNDTHDQWHICCGHDLICILSIGLCKAIGTNHTNDVRPEVLERELRLAFDTSHFRQTKLYRAIREWERANVPFIVLAADL